MHPGPEMYLISPWISDTQIVFGQYGQFRAVIPTRSPHILGLKEVLGLLVERGCKVRILVRDTDLNRSFLRALPEKVEWKFLSALHQKGWVTHHFYLRGSMNFTHSGINLNDENIEITTEDNDIARALIDARHVWENA